MSYRRILPTFLTSLSGTKIVVGRPSNKLLVVSNIFPGTQLGPLTIFDRSKGYGDCVDRFLGHPSSVETMVSLSSSQITQDVIATGSSDGLIRVVQIHPSKFLGVIAAHGGSSADQEEGESKDQAQQNTEGLPIERMKLDRHKKWLGSISHDELLKLTDIEGALEGSGSDSDEKADEGVSAEADSDQEDNASKGEEQSEGEKNEDDVVEDNGSNAEEPEALLDQGSDSESPPPQTDPKQSKKRKKKELKREERKRQKKGGPVTTFFADL